MNIESEESKWGRKVTVDHVYFIISSDKSVDIFVTQLMKIIPLGIPS